MCTNPPKLLAAAALLAVSGLASATNSSGTLTADNAFWLYTGNASGSDLHFVGSGNNWTTPNSFSFDAAAGDYLYVMAQDFGQPHAWQGVFSTPSGTVYSNAASWVAYATPNTTVNAAVIAGATWGGIGTDLSANSGPWGNRVGDTGAHWIWSSGIYSNDMTVLFRTANPVNTAAAVPEADTAAMMLAGLALLGAAARRRKAKQA